MVQRDSLDTQREGHYNRRWEILVCYLERGEFWQ